MPDPKRQPAVVAAINAVKSKPNPDVWPGGMIGWNRITRVLLADGWHECKQFCLTDVESSGTSEREPGGLYAQWTEIGGTLHDHEFSVPFHRIIAFAEPSFDI